MLQSRVCCEHGVVGLDNGVRHRWCGVDTELELRLLAIVGGQTLEDEGTETRTSSSTEGVEDEEALQTVAVVREAANLVHDGVDHLLTDRVVTASIWWALHVSNGRGRDNVYSQLLAASSLPVTRVSGWKRLL